MRLTLTLLGVWLAFIVLIIAFFQGASGRDNSNSNPD